MSHIEIVDLATYGLTAVKKACYKFSNDFSVKLEPEQDSKLRILFEFSSNTTVQDQKKLIDDFYVELLDQDLRDTIYKETEAIRNLILAEAFSKTTLIEAE